MGLFSFIANAGKKLFGGDKDADEGKPIQQLNDQQITALRQHIAGLGLHISNLGVQFNGPGEVTITGEAATPADYQKAALMAGNVMGISKVNNLMTVAPQQAAALPE